METPSNPTSVSHRIGEALARLAQAMRADDWTRARSRGLNPAQLAILEHLDDRPGGQGVREIATQLCVSQPSATDSISALERKGLVVKVASPNDRRAVNVAISATGRETLRSADGDGPAERSAASLPEAERTALLLSLITMIRTLQEAGAIPIQRMCVSCRYFRPYAHADADRPHHCQFVDAAFGSRNLRVDCREHETADPAFRAATWDVFSGATANPPG